MINLAREKILQLEGVELNRAIADKLGIHPISNDRLRCPSDTKRKTWQWEFLDADGPCFGEVFASSEEEAWMLAWESECGTTDLPAWAWNAQDAIELCHLVVHMLKEIFGSEHADFCAVWDNKKTCRTSMIWECGGTGLGEVVEATNMPLALARLALLVLHHGKKTDDENLS